MIVSSRRSYNYYRSVTSHRLLYVACSHYLLWFLMRSICFMSIASNIDADFLGLAAKNSARFEVVISS
jgi:hypothetical protein